MSMWRLKVVSGVEGMEYKKNQGLGRVGGKARADHSKKAHGFTLLEVMTAMAIISITLVVVFGSQSQSVSLASEAKFTTTAALLAQSKIAELEAENSVDVASSSGDFGEDFPGYRWELTVSDVGFADTEKGAEHLRQIDLKLVWGDHDQYGYKLRLYRFVPSTK